MYRNNHMILPKSSGDTFVRQYGNKKRQATRLCLLAIILLLIAISGLSCKGKESEVTYEHVVTLHPGYSITEEGVLYTDSKAYARQCYFDFATLRNVYFCSKPNCDHTSLDCTARAVRDWHFIVDEDRYYLESQTEMDDNKQQIMRTYLYQSDMSNTRTKAVAWIDGALLSDQYLLGNQLYLLAREFEIKDGVNTSYASFCLNIVDLKTFSVERIPIRDGHFLDMIPCGISNHKLILYYRYYDNEIDARDYGMTDSFENFMKDEVNFQKYMQAVMEVFHEGMSCFDLNSLQLEELDLPIPLLVSGEYYYYNKHKPDNSNELIVYSFTTKQEEVLMPTPAYSVSEVGDTLFILEGYEGISDITGQPHIRRDTAGRKYAYDIITKGMKELEGALPEDAQLRMIGEYKEFYIFLYTNIKEGISQRIGYILKEDYLNGKMDYIIVDPI